MEDLAGRGVFSSRSETTAHGSRQPQRNNSRRQQPQRDRWRRGGSRSSSSTRRSTITQGLCLQLPKLCGGGQRVFAASSLDGAAREQQAAMEAGGGAVEAPPKKGQLKDRPAAGRRGRKSVRTFWARFSFFSLFSYFFSHIKRGFFPKKGARAADGSKVPGKASQ